MSKPTDRIRSWLDYRYNVESYGLSRKSVLACSHLLSDTAALLCVLQLLDEADDHEAQEKSGGQGLPP